MSKAHILAEIKRTAQANGGAPLGWRRFATETGITYYDWCGKFWARWGDAVREAGLAPNELSASYSEDVLWAALCRLTRDLQHIPTTGELRLETRRTPNFPSEKVFRRLGTRAARIAGLARFCADREGFDDVAAICAASARPVEAGVADDDDVAAPDSIGFVYLLRSGRHHKIGRTNSIGRRERELAIQLPEKAKLVHSISTDDPAGIEVYWHRRFEGKRVNGEWFVLTALDVAAFRRRKFM